MPFKDVFRSDPEVAGENGTPEALLSALSTGPVGLGDRVGRTDPALVMATCRADGVLIKPDVPIAAVDASMLGAPAFASELMVAECHSDHPAGRWSYVVGMHTNPSDDEVSGDIVFADLGDSAPKGDVIVWDWRARTATRADPGTRWPVSLPKEGWAYLVLAPILVAGQLTGGQVAAGQLAVIGDVSKFVSAGDARIVVESRGEVVRVTVKGAGETVDVTGWSTGPVTATTIDGGKSSPEFVVDRDPDTGLWALPVSVGSRGWATVELRAGID
ncbi:MAG TPA: hypothetical protein VL068_02030 [Microthrixaceae bacterium]|nr:hypothetical protein [Microthrixaceae bacterium]